jgi:hypothetical protein
MQTPKTFPQACTIPITSTFEHPYLPTSQTSKPLTHARKACPTLTLSMHLAPEACMSASDAPEACTPPSDPHTYTHSKPPIFSNLTRLSLPLPYVATTLSFDNSTYSSPPTQLGASTGTHRNVR